MRGPTKQKGVRITTDTRNLIRRLSEQYGFSQQQIVDLAIASLSDQIESERALIIRPKAAKKRKKAPRPPKHQPS
jgi:replication initiation and membrane attachment protein DnaB